MRNSGTHHASNPSLFISMPTQHHTLWPPVLEAPPTSSVTASCKPAPASSLRNHTTTPAAVLPSWGGLQQSTSRTSCTPLLAPRDCLRQQQCMCAQTLCKWDSLMHTWMASRLLLWAPCDGHIIASYTLWQCTVGLVACSWVTQWGVDTVQHSHSE